MPNNNYASRDDFWRFHSREFKTETFPGLGKVRIQSLSDGEQRDLAAKTRDEFGRLKDTKYTYAYRAIAQIVDPETGEPMFGEVDLENLKNMRSSVTYPIFEAMLAFATGSAPEPDDPDEADEALKKSSETIPNSTSSTS